MNKKVKKIRKPKTHCTKIESLSDGINYVINKAKNKKGS